MKHVGAALLLASAMCSCADPGAVGRGDHTAKFEAGVAQARREIREGAACVYLTHAERDAEIRVDRVTGLPIRGREICGTDVDVDAYEATIDGYMSEIRRAHTAGELEAQRLDRKIPDEAGLRRRFATEDSLIAGASPEGSLRLGATDHEVRWQSLPSDVDKRSYALAVRDSGLLRASLPVNRAPLRILLDHEESTLLIEDPSGTVAAIDLPSAAWIAVFPLK